MSRKRSVYTGAGDDGETCLAGGRRVPKTDRRIAAYGGVDELNAAVGLALVALDSTGGEETRRLSAFLIETQSRLFELGAELARLPEDATETAPRVQREAVEGLEAEIDALDASLPELRSFVLPGGGPASAALHFARTVCRRVEIAILSLHDESPVRSEVLAYVNRLSDYLFVASRLAARAAGVPETCWKP